MWEYGVRYIKASDSDLEIKLNDLGRSDWEVYQIIKSESSVFYSEYQIFCKRQVKK